ncbi:hypothetical protein T492DRAFT_986414 [Pavlovales sp. CCMP2436]|nr:hypothetical protein T492DRAFT_986414 [Pavlovales sp. CCMP2436]|eukprot:CAMPEP_0179984532 /NCGR_PEP_ID=MMETSP0984-20121128/1187_1 /TAXON_ID=483367 /ORGANISM="non described non described, Strain CCMP 2436" /LENGTH=429 /DNA_ID=CAMNT_0021903133 /DNA_START=15 /DNA_END=1304 /DNA_ORIENTATION=-
MARSGPMSQRSDSSRGRVFALLLALPAVFALAIPAGFVRLSTPAANRYELQTLSMSVQLGEMDVDLIGTVHIASSGYFAALLADASAADCSLCELIVPERCLSRDERGLLRLTDSVAPTPEQSRLAGQLGLTHQLDGLPYGADRRFSLIADTPAEQLLPAPSSSSQLAEVVQTIRRGSIRGAAMSAARARRGPPPSQQLVRGLAWVVPCPELTLLVLDWSWSRTRPQLSAILEPLLRALASFDLRSARRLAFAQLLLSSSAEGGGSTGAVFSGGGVGARIEPRMKQRNMAAADALDTALRSAGDRDRIALFYGPSHLEGPSGIVAELLARWPGATIVDVSWRTAFAVELGDRPAQEQPVQRIERLLLPAYLAIDGIDWWLTWADVASETGVTGGWSDDALLLGAYVLRHGLLYWSLSRFALDWSGRFED